jgi:ferric-dicitrate binding protein FerR (iron transport regulator)
MNKKYEAKQLISKYHQGTATPEERLLVEQWFLIDLEESNVLPGAQAMEQADQRISANLSAHIQSGASDQKVYKLWPRIAAAAAILLVIGAGLFFYTTRHLEGSAATRDLLNSANDIAPGKNTATITLTNGKTIQLSDAKTGVIIDATSLKYNDGSTVETGDARHLDDRRDPLNSTGKRSLPGGRDDEKAEMTSVATPRGGTYQITLPDGTKVWLNAASSLSFPSTFQGLGNRKVELSGEAYFEVAKDKTHPFIVSSSKQEVEVLGTHFNINSYADEQVTRTTLLEGSVRVAYVPGHLESSRHLEPSRHFESSRHLDDRRDLLNSTDKGSLPAGRDDGARRNDGARRDDGQSAAITLKPNQQSVLTTTNQILVKNVEPEDAIAWKNGYFMFNTETLQEVMNKVARWYDVNVQYPNPEVKKLKFSGTMSRYDNISQILKKIAAISNVSYSIKGKTVFLK